MDKLVLRRSAAGVTQMAGHGLGQKQWVHRLIDEAAHCLASLHKQAKHRLPRRGTLHTRAPKNPPRIALRRLETRHSLSDPRICGHGTFTTFQEALTAVASRIAAETHLQ